ncbi:MAG: N-acetylmuramoyl-L-alanine amidase [Hyphomicrobium sp.]|nr:N-acetylmuramoyl-L-alanine amidase [Hyphomicrobium sp.]
MPALADSLQASRSGSASAASCFPSGPRPYLASILAFLFLGTFIMTTPSAAEEVIAHHEELDLYPEIPLADDPRFTAKGIPTIEVPSAGPRPMARYAGSVQLVYPTADRRFSMRVKGHYANGYPVGAVVHSTEGRSKKGDIDAENTITGTGIPNGHCYFCISSTGKVYQPFLLDSWGIHCGKTYHPDLGFALDNKLVGIEVCCAGIVKKVADDRYHPGWSETFTEAEVRYRDKTENIQKAGHYHQFNAAQEKALFDLLIWLKTNNPLVFKLEHVFGHDEIATNAPQGQPGDKTLGRKQDPGGSLSMFMKDLRAKLLAAMPSG